MVRWATPWSWQYARAMTTSRIKSFTSWRKMRFCAGPRVFFVGGSKHSLVEMHHRMNYEIYKMMHITYYKLLLFYCPAIYVYILPSDLQTRFRFRRLWVIDAMVEFREVSTIAKLRDHKEGILLQPRHQPFQPLHPLPGCQQRATTILQGHQNYLTSENTNMMTRQQCGALRCTLLLEVFLILERSQELNESKNARTRS